MSYRPPPDLNTDARATAAAGTWHRFVALRVADFCDALIAAGSTPGRGGLRWRPFVGKASVERELTRRGHELCEDGANHDPSLKRFFAAPRPEAP